MPPLHIIIGSYGLAIYAPVLGGERGTVDPVGLDVYCRYPVEKTPHHFNMRKPGFYCHPQRMLEVHHDLFHGKAQEPCGKNI